MEKNDIRNAIFTLNLTPRADANNEEFNAHPAIDGMTAPPILTLSLLAGVCCW